MNETFENFRWANADYTAILCPVVSLVYGLIDFQAMPTDPEVKGRQIYEECIAWKYGDIAPYQPDSPESS